MAVRRLSLEPQDGDRSEVAEGEQSGDTEPGQSGRAPSRGQGPTASDLEPPLFTERRKALMNRATK